MIQRLKVFKKIYKILPKLFIVMAMLLIVSCAASIHRGKITVPKPPLNETTEAVWYNYWQDQLDGFAGMVIAPTAEYPEAAKQGYQRAALDWSDKVKDASAKTYIVTELGGLIGALLLLSILL